MMDSYLGDELLVETNHEVLRHLENCPACRNELAARRGLLARMRSAFRSAPEMQMNQSFAAKLRNDLRENALRPSIWDKLKSGVFINSPIFAAAIAVSLLVGILFGAAFWLRRVPSASNDVVAEQNKTEKPAENLPRTEPNNAAISAQTIEAAWRETAQLAVGDHKNCALHFRLKEKPITLAAAAEKYGLFNKDLDKAVKNVLRRIPAEKVSGENAGKIQLLDAHSCVFNNRRFAHIILKRGKETISVLVTDVDSINESDEAIKNQTAENYQVAGFRAKNHAVFVVSDLSKAENSAIAEILLPAVRRHIEQAEA